MAICNYLQKVPMYFHRKCLCCIPNTCVWLLLLLISSPAPSSKITSGNNVSSFSLFSMAPTRISTSKLMNIHFNISNHFKGGKQIELWSIILHNRSEQSQISSIFRTANNIWTRFSNNAVKQLKAIVIFKRLLFL